MPNTDTPKFSSYDVVIIGGAIMGSATAWFLSQMEGFDGRVLVVERDPSYERCSTAHTNSCMRQQFSTALNVQISQYAAEFVISLRDQMGGDPRIPDLDIQNFGYLYLASTDRGAQTLRENHALQTTLGAGTELMSAEDVRARYPFMQVDDVLLASINRRNEGYWDGGTVFEWFRRKARENGVDYLAGEVVGLIRDGHRVTHVTLSCGTQIACGHVVNAAGPRAACIASMAGIILPVEPRKRFTWVVTAESPLPVELPLTVDPSGVHFRTDGPETYMIGAAPEADVAVDVEDFTMDADRWLDHVWPLVAARIPAFERLRIVTEWAGHYAYNPLDQNAILGPHPDMENLLFQNGFSGHGLQQSPAMGRGIAEWITYGDYRALDLSPFGFDRFAKGALICEKAVI